MKKVKINSTFPKIILGYTDIEIEVKTYLTLGEQIFLITKYVEDYFGNPEEIYIEKSKYHYLEAECRLMNIIYQLCTNIDMDNIDNDIYSNQTLWNLITRNINNYVQFRTRLDYIVQGIIKREELEYSIGYIAQSLIKSLEQSIQKLSEISPDTIKEIQNAGINMVERLEKSTIMKNPNDLSKLEEPFIREIEERK